MKLIQKHSDLIVLGILWIVSLLMLQSKFNAGYIIPNKAYVGMGLLVLITLWRVVRRKHFKIVLSIFLFVGCIGLIQFSVSTNYLSWGDSDNPTLKLHFSPISIILLLLLLALNVAKISIMHTSPEETVEKRSQQSEAYLDKYYNELREKETVYLQGILATPERWQKEYLEAAEKVLMERT